MDRFGRAHVDNGQGEQQTGTNHAEADEVLAQAMDYIHTSTVSLNATRRHHKMKHTFKRGGLFKLRSTWKRPRTLSRRSPLLLLLLLLSVRLLRLWKRAKATSLCASASRGLLSLLSR